jgi:hypothetical protein
MVGEMQSSCHDIPYRRAMRAIVGIQHSDAPMVSVDGEVDEIVAENQKTREDAFLVSAGKPVVYRRRRSGSPRACGSRPGPIKPAVRTKQAYPGVGVLLQATDGKVVAVVTVERSDIMGSVFLRSPRTLSVVREGSLDNGQSSFSRAVPGFGWSRPCYRPACGNVESQRKALPFPRNHLRAAFAGPTQKACFSTIILGRTTPPNPLRKW